MSVLTTTKFKLVQGSMRLQTSPFSFVNNKIGMISHCHQSMRGDTTHLSLWVGEWWMLPLPQTDCKQWAWKSWSKMSGTSLLSPSNQRGYMRPFLPGWNYHLPQPDMHTGNWAFVWRRLWTTRQQMWLKPRGCCPPWARILCVTPKSPILQLMMKLSVIHSVSKVNNFLLGKVGEKHITSYVIHISNHPNAHSRHQVIVPDIHAFWF